MLVRLRPSARRVALAHKTVAAYADWRAASERVHRAYRQWTTARPADRPVAFDEYRHALNTEEAAAYAYAQTAQRAAW